MCGLDSIPAWTPSASGAVSAVMPNEAREAPPDFARLISPRHTIPLSSQLRDIRRFTGQRIAECADSVVCPSSRRRSHHFRDQVIGASAFSSGPLQFESILHGCGPRIAHRRYSHVETQASTQTAGGMLPILRPAGLAGAPLPLERCRWPDSNRKPHLSLCAHTPIKCALPVELQRHICGLTRLALERRRVPRPLPACDLIEEVQMKKEGAEEGDVLRFFSVPQKMGPKLTSFNQSYLGSGRLP